MKKGTKIGWLLITLSLVLSVWVITSQSSKADKTTEDGFVLSDDGKTLISYQGAGGNISVPAGVTTINASVFANNTSITGVSLPNTVTLIGSNLFAGCSNLQTVSLGRVSSIPSDTFQNCISLSSVSIPSTVTSLGGNSFYGCSALGSISLPSSVTSVADSAFEECNNLTSISIPSNSFYSTYDGCLYNSSGSRLIMVPPGKSSIAFGPSASTIGSGAFKGNYNITSLTVPGTVSSIESGAFSDSAIDTITIPRSVSSMGAQSGWSPFEIYGYHGTAAERFANSNNIPFVDLDPNTKPQDPKEDDDPDDPGDPDDEDDSDDSDDGDDTDDTNDGGNKNGKKNKGNKSNGNGKSNGGGGSYRGNGGNGGNGSTSGGRGSSRGGKDATPKTADGEVDPRFLLCGGLLFGGLFIILNGDRRKLAMVAKKRKRDEE